MAIVKKIDNDNGTVTILNDGVLSEVPFDKFLTIPIIDDVVQITSSVDGASKYIIISEVSEGKASTKSKVLAGLLGVFLGGLGIHNFYLGHTGKAVIQLLIGVLGWIVLMGWIANLWGFIEGIVILTSKKGSSWHQDSQGLELED